LFPELTGTPEPVVTALSDVALNYVSEGVFQRASQYALALVVAHFVKLDQMAGGGSVTMDKVGDIQTQQAALPTDVAMKMTSYGIRFLELARMNRFPTMASNQGNMNLPPFSGPQDTWDRSRARPW
jgi:hypothetical protein